MALIETEELTKIYNEKLAVNNVDLSIREGELFVILGPSGAGKTTLLRLLDLLEEPTSGRIMFDAIDTGASEQDRLRVRRQIGMVFQRSIMFNDSVRNNVAYPLRIRGIRNNMSRRVEEALELVGLEDFGRRHALTLSGGEAQRVSLAQAMVFHPKLLLLDEPTANLDPRSVSLIESIVTQINHREHMTIVMATHNIAQAEHLASRVAVLSEGVLAEVGDVRDVIKKPSELFVSFAANVNVYSGQAHPLEDGMSVIEIGGNLRIEAATRKRGKVTVFIKPEDIILSTTPIKTSARNILKGRVREIVDLAERVQLKIDTGRQFTVIITKRSFRELAITLDSELYLNFKATSVRVI
jgi:tungstate transport system ATP-binding protein